MRNCLCLDPSLTGFGWSVIIGDLIKDFGCISSKKDSTKKQKDDYIERISNIITTLNKLIDDYSINLILFEIPLGSKSSLAAKALALVEGSIISMCISRKIEFKYITASEVKKRVCNNRTAEKTEILEAVKLRFDGFGDRLQKTKLKDLYNISDSVAVFIALEKEIKKN
jgi:Holliday junction resolvasome RuvABC endonuclease subunit